MEENPYEPSTIRSDPPLPKWWWDNPDIENVCMMLIPVLGAAAMLAALWIRSR